MPRASANPFRFSTKEYHAGSGLYDYGYRFYSAGLGRWINRDPIRENGGINLYVMVGNNPTNKVDEYGLNGKGGHGKGERNRTRKPGGTDRPTKGFRELKPPQPGHVYAPTPDGKGKIVARPPEMPFPDGEGAKDGGQQSTFTPPSGGDIAAGTAIVGGGYIIYRCVRLLPSLAPPLWPTLPANIAIP